MPILTAEERVGSLIAGKYRLDAILGRGGMGVVFAATHTWTDRPVAVKLLHPETARDPAVAQRFLGEARAAATLRHPNVVDVLDMGEDADGAVYLVLEMLDGQSLAARLERGPLDVPEAMATLLPVMDALDAAHTKGTVHRDLKPENIFLSHDSTGRSVPKVLDFGIAKRNDASALGVKTATGQLLGTPYYMSPEQARGAADLGPQSDVWSMGVVWFETLSQKLPHDDESLGALIIKLVTVPAPSVSTVVKDLPAPIAAAIDGAMKIERTERHASMAAFVNALRAAAEECGIEIPASSAAENAPRKNSTSPPAAAIGLANTAASSPPHVETMSAVSRNKIENTASEPRRRAGSGTWGVAAAVTVCLVGGVMGLRHVRASQSTGSSSAASTPASREARSTPAPTPPIVPTVIAPTVIAVASDAATAAVPIVAPLTPPASDDPGAPHAHAASTHTHASRTHSTAGETPTAAPPAEAPAHATTAAPNENRAPEIRNQF